MNFSQALELIKEGKCLARAGWNGVKLIENKFVPEGREPIVFNGIVYTKLCDGSIAICDECDYDLIDGYKWSIQKGYAVRTELNEDKSRSNIRMHQVIMPDCEMIDHINGDKLDNRRANLRECNSQQNNANRSGKTGTSKFKGVSFDSSRNKWISSIQVNGKTKHIGRFSEESEAAKAYDLVSSKTYGEFAKLNFPETRMFVFLVPGSTFNVSRPPLLGIFEEGTEIHYHPHIDMKTATGEIVPWICSQSDMLALDWNVVDGPIKAC